MSRALAPPFHKIFTSGRLCNRSPRLTITNPTDPQFSLIGASRKDYLLLVDPSLAYQHTSLSNMPARKRKSSVTAVESPATRRQSGRVVKKAALNYQESDVEEAGSDEEFKADVNESEAADEADDVVESESGDEYGSDEEVLKKKGWTKTKGKGGRVEMVIELPGIKDPGDTPYEDERIHPNTLDFLRDLKKNNRREWLKFHDAPYRSVFLILMLFTTSYELIIDLGKPRRISRLLSANSQRLCVTKIPQFLTYQSRILSFESTATCDFRLIPLRTSRTFPSHGRGLGERGHMRIIIYIFNLTAEASLVRLTAIYNFSPTLVTLN
jgi:Conserved hypothetical protein (DUF2461)